MNWKEVRKGYEENQGIWQPGFMKTATGNIKLTEEKQGYSNLQVFIQRREGTCSLLPQRQGQNQWTNYKEIDSSYILEDIS